tara:strand:- start:554 stop:856 length:303 start_codon:yes stop_codon:yes gene_type:complete
MRKHTTKKINNKAKTLLIDWVKSLVSEKEQEKVNEQNFMQMLPRKEYIESNRTYYMAFYTYRWTKQSIKKLLKNGYTLEQITIKDLQSLMSRVKSNSAVL